MSYFNSLDTLARSRYKDKTSLKGNKDPYAIPAQQWSDDVSTWADVDLDSIVAYLVISTSFHTFKELKAIKSCESYKFFVDNWIKDVRVCLIDGLCVHKAKVSYLLVCSS